MVMASEQENGESMDDSRVDFGVEDSTAKEDESCELDVAIIGAGVAGLACAAKLQELAKGLRIRIFEASGQVGGRACSTKVGGFTVDAGAGWIHGTKGNPIIEDGLLSSDDIIPCTERNIWVAGPGCTDSSNFQPTAEENLRWRARLTNTSDDSSGADLLSLLNGVSDGWSTADERFLKSTELWFGATAKELCSVEWAPDTCLGDFPGPHAVVKGGAAVIAERLRQRACHGHEDMIVLNQPVEAISEDQQGVQLQFSSQSLRARWVVCTVSLGVLQQSRPAIEPPLPASLQEAIQRLRMSNYCKCFMVVSEDVARCWPTWTWTDHALFPMAFSYFSVKGVPILLCTSVSRDLETMADESVCDAAATALGLRSADVLACHVTRWSAAEWFRGAYSFSPPECDFTEVDAFVTAMEGRRLVFAGEHTHDEHQGALHGAYLSGLRAAEHVASRAAGAFA